VARLGQRRSADVQAAIDAGLAMTVDQAVEFALSRRLAPVAAGSHE
jgi:hypothetical protein